MNLTLIYDGDERLAQLSKHINKVNKFVIKLSHYMHQNLKPWNGIGLSAVQVGYPIRLIVVNTMHTKDGRCLTLINPKLLSVSGEPSSKIEGCLSFPGKYKYRLRPPDISVEYTDTGGHTKVEAFTGLTAQVIVHELFHLEGITMNHENIDNFNLLITDSSSENNSTVR